MTVYFPRLFKQLSRNPADNYNDRRATFMPPIPEWFKGVIKLDPPPCPVAELKETNPDKDACLQARLKEGIPQISLEEIAKDPNYIVFPNGGISYENAMSVFRNNFFPNGMPDQPWSPQPVASYYIDHRKCTAWNFKGECILFDAYAPTVAHRSLAKGTVISMQVDIARYVENKCNSFNNTDDCFDILPEVIASALVLQSIEPQDVVVLDRGPYVPGREFDATKGQMFRMAKTPGIKEGEMPVIVYIVAVPRSSFDASAEIYF